MDLELLQSYFDSIGPQFVANGHVNRWDANESLVFARNLESVMNKAYNQRYPALKARMMIPVNTEGGDNETFLYRGYQDVGQAGWVDDKSLDFPNVSMNGAEEAGIFQTFGVHYKFSDDQVARSRLLGVGSLDASLALVARRSCDRFLDNVAVKGGVGSLKGLATDTNVTALAAGTALATGTWASRAQTDAGAQTIISDINVATGQIFLGTLNDVTPDQLTLALPSAAYKQLLDRQVSTYDTRTLLQYLVDTRRIGAIEVWPALDTANGGAARGVIYLKDPDTVELLIPKDFTQSAPFREGFTTKVWAKVKTGGTVIHRPSQIRYLDGIA